MISYCLQSTHQGVFLCMLCSIYDVPLFHLFIESYLISCFIVSRCCTMIQYIQFNKQSFTPLDHMAFEKHLLHGLLSISQPIHHHLQRHRRHDATSHHLPHDCECSRWVPWDVHQGLWCHFDLSHANFKLYRIQITNHVFVMLID